MLRFFSTTVFIVVAKILTIFEIPSNSTKNLNGGLLLASKRLMFLKGFPIHNYSAKVLSNFDNAKPFEKRMKKKRTGQFSYALRARSDCEPKVVIYTAEVDHENPPLSL